MSASPSGEPNYYSLNRNYFIKLGGGLWTQLSKLRMPTWGTNTRPDTPKEGTYGYNIETNTLEIYDGTAWYGSTFNAL